MRIETFNDSTVAVLFSESEGTFNERVIPFRSIDNLRRFAVELCKAAGSHPAQAKSSIENDVLRHERDVARFEMLEKRISDLEHLIVPIPDKIFS